MRYALPYIAATALAIAILAAAPAPAAGLDQDTQLRLLNEATEAFRDGNRLRAAGDPGAQAFYEKAALRLERIIREGGVENGKLYYNLGNIWFLRGDLGRAILNYLRAEQYIPNDVHLHQNLAFVRQQRTDSFRESEARKLLKTLFFWHYDFSSHTRLTLFAIAYLLLWGLAAARLYWKRPELTVAAGACALVAGLFFLSLTVESSRYWNAPKGVVIAGESIGRKGDGETYQPSFSDPLHAGTEFTVRDDRGSWILVALPDERTCWLPRGDVALVREAPGAGAP